MKAFLLVLSVGFGIAMALMGTFVTRGAALWITAAGGAVVLFVLWWLQGMAERSREGRR